MTNFPDFSLLYEFVRDFLDYYNWQDDNTPQGKAYQKKWKEAIDNYLRIVESFKPIARKLHAKIDLPIALAGLMKDVHFGLNLVSSIYRIKDRANEQLSQLEERLWKEKERLPSSTHQLMKSLGSKFASTQPNRKVAYGIEINEDRGAIESAIWSSFDQSRFVSVLANKMINAAKGGKNERESRRFLEKLLERFEVNSEVVDAVMEIMFPPKRGRRSSLLLKASKNPEFRQRLISKLGNMI